MVDLVFYNGMIHTMDGVTASAVAVSDGRIEAVGSDDEILKLVSGPAKETGSIGLSELRESNKSNGSKCQVIDLKGACMTPGFNDSHCHFLSTGIDAENLNLHGVTSVEELIQRGRDYIEKHQIPQGTWVHGVGFDQNLFDEKTLLDGKVADAISTRHPVLLERVCGHVGAANRMALKMAGYTEVTEVIGGEIEKDAEGHMTGILKEAALDAFTAQIPRPNVEETMAVIERTAHRFNACGITSVQTDDLGEVDTDTMLKAYRRLEKEGRLNLRIFEEVRAARPSELDDFLAYGLRTGDGADYFKIGNIKLFLDGSLGARTAYMREPYADDPGSKGIPVYTQEELDEVVLMAHKAGMQIACHAIGDGAVEQCVNAFEKAYESDGKHMRDRVVHCQFADDELLGRMAAAGIASDIQPPFTVSDAIMTPVRLGERQWCGYRWKTMLDMGINLGGGSDSPVEPFDVIWGIHCVVNRTDREGRELGVPHPEQKLTAREALALYTTGGAYLSFDEERKGKIKKGYLADLTVLSQDILSVPPEKILDTQVLMTVVGGRVVYQKGSE